MVIDGSGVSRIAAGRPEGTSWPAKTEWWGRQRADWLSGVRGGKVSRAMEQMGKQRRFGGRCAWAVMC